MKKVFILIIILISTLLLSGCWDLKDIDDRVIILGIAIDYADKPQAPNYLKSDMIKLTLQVAIPQKLTGGAGQAPPMGEETIWTVSAFGDTVAEALKHLRERLQYDLFFGHVRVIVISRDAAEEGINRYINYFRNHPQFRRLSYILISEKKAEKILTTFPKTATVQSVYLMNLIETAINEGTMPDVSFMEFIVRMVNKGIDPVTVMVGVSDDTIKNLGLAVFKGDKMVGHLDNYETWNFIQLAESKIGGIDSVRDVETELGKVTIEFNELSASKKPVLLKNGKFKFIFKMDIDAWTIYQEVSTDYTNPVYLDELENRASLEFKREMETIVYKVQKKFQADIFGFGEMVRAYLPSKWKEIEDWRQKFTEAEIEGKVNVNLRRIGMTTFIQQ